MQKTRNEKNKRKSEEEKKENKEEKKALHYGIDAKKILSKENRKKEKWKLKLRIRF
jgi:hypothetical protein